MFCDTVEILNQLELLIRDLGLYCYDSQFFADCEKFKVNVTNSI